MAAFGSACPQVGDLPDAPGGRSSGHAVGTVPDVPRRGSGSRRVRVRPDPDRVTPNLVHSDRHRTGLVLDRVHRVIRSVRAACIRLVTLSRFRWVGS
ncbi:hypothetical protein AB0K14_11970 [Actinosynnema sp. NPDC050801]|uniref:hypothetical protein n=1 Tax=unclassified Actinosynnema TaxID=2637065 RepID=UPI00340CD30B